MYVCVFVCACVRAYRYESEASLCLTKYQNIKAYEQGITPRILKSWAQRSA
jgi:hypothetical protein